MPAYRWFESASPPLFPPWEEVESEGMGWLGNFLWNLKMSRRALQAIFARE